MCLFVIVVDFVSVCICVYASGYSIISINLFYSYLSIFLSSSSSFMLLARIYQTLSHHSSLSSIAPSWSSRLYILCPYRAVVDKFFLVGQHWGSLCEELHRRKLLLRSSLLLQCLSYLDGFRDGNLVAVQLLIGGMLLPGFVQYSS